MLTGIIAAVCGAMFVAALIVALCAVRALLKETGECKQVIRADSRESERVLHVVQEQGTVTVVGNKLADQRSVPQVETWRREQ